MTDDELIVREIDRRPVWEKLASVRWADSTPEDENIIIDTPNHDRAMEAFKVAMREEAEKIKGRIQPETLILRTLDGRIDALEEALRDMASHKGGDSRP